MIQILSKSRHAATVLLGALLVTSAAHADSGDASRPSFEGVVELAEIRLGEGAAQAAWESAFSWGGDKDRIVVEFNGGGQLNHRIDEIEALVMYERSLGEGVSLLVGGRHFLRPKPHQSSAAMAIEAEPLPGLTLEGMVYLAETGNVTGEANLFYELDLLPRLSAEIRIETGWAAQAIPEEDTGAGFGEAEAALRFRYAVNDIDLPPSEWPNF